MTSSQPTPSEEQQVGLTAEDIAEIRRRADDDVFYFGRVICGHKDLVFEDHAPMMYAAAGDAPKLLAILRNPNIRSETVKEFRRECIRHDFDIWADDAEGRCAELLRIVDLRFYRGGGKSSSVTHPVRLWKMIRWPDMSSALITNVDDPKARDFCKQIRATILSKLFAVVYPDRVPADPKSMLTERSLTVAGRTVPDKEPCLMVFGYKASPTGYHYDEIEFDDLVGRENRSVVELAMVREFLANVRPLCNPGIRFPIRRVHVGTRWDEDDDAAYVRANPQCFAITVPIWRRNQPSDDLRIPGVPTTQWCPLETIIEIQDDILSNPEEGALSWRCNYELDPSAGGGRIFPAELVDNADWIPYRDAKVTEGREWMVRPVFHETGELTGQKVVKVYDNGAPVYKYLSFNPDVLYKVTTCDQSFSEDGDEWAVATVGMDQYNHRFVLEVRKGHTVEAMLDAILMQFLTWNPRRIGMEKIAAQHVIELVLKLGDKYRRIRSYIEAVSHENKPKEWRIRNYVAEVMRMHRLWLNPHDAEMKSEMKKYKPGKNAKDNGIDCLAMAEVLIQKSTQAKEGEEDYRTKFSRINRQIAAKRDRATGISLW